MATASEYSTHNQGNNDIVKQYVLHRSQSNSLKAPWKRPASQIMSPSNEGPSEDHIINLYTQGRRSFEKEQPKVQVTWYSNGQNGVSGGMGEILHSKGSNGPSSSIITRSSSVNRSVVNPTQSNVDSSSFNKAKILEEQTDQNNNDDEGYPNVINFFDQHGRKLIISLSILILSAILLSFFLWPRQLTVSVVDIQPTQPGKLHEFYFAEDKMGVMSNSKFITNLENNNFLPLRIKQAVLNADWVLLDGGQLSFSINNTLKDISISLRSSKTVALPLDIDRLADPSSDPIFQDFLTRCLASPSQRQPIHLIIRMDFDLRSGGRKTKKSLNYTFKWPCPAELSASNLAIILEASGFSPKKVIVKGLDGRSIADLAKQ